MSSAKMPYIPAGRPTCRVSVVIPTRNRRDLLLRTLDALAAQTFADFETVLVDDGSTDGTAQAIASLGFDQFGPGSIRVIDGGGNGAVKARILGIANTTGELLAFTDSDCIPEPDWLQCGVAAIDAGADLVNGLTLAERPYHPLERSMESGSEGLYPTCNMIYRRDAYQRAGGFDDGADRRWGFRFDRRARGDGFGEDSLMAWRVIRNGGRAHFEPLALVRHVVMPRDRRETWSRMIRVAAFPALIREIPELRQTLLRHRVVLSPNSALVWYLSAVLLATRWRRLGWVPIAMAMANWWRKGSGAVSDRTADAIELTLLDGTRAVSMMVGSVKAKTLIL